MRSQLSFLNYIQAQTKGERKWIRFISSHVHFKRKRGKKIMIIIRWDFLREPAGVQPFPVWSSSLAEGNAVHNNKKNMGKKGEKRWCWNASISSLFARRRRRRRRLHISERVRDARRPSTLGVRSLFKLFSSFYFLPAVEFIALILNSIFPHSSTWGTIIGDQPAIEKETWFSNSLK